MNDSRPNRRPISRHMARPVAGTAARSAARPAARLQVSTSRSRTRGLAAALGVLVVAAVVLTLLRPPPQEPSDSAALASETSGTPAVTATDRLLPTATATPAVAPSSTRPSPTRSATPAPTDQPPATATPPPATPVPTRDPNAAPRSAAEFDLDEQAIDILFPIAVEARYRYRDNFLQRRAGDPVGYNHARWARDGQLVRLHDGIDIYATAGEPVLAPFSGVVVDPRARWRPWDRSRYGVTVVVISNEPATAGYAAVMVHLDRAKVGIGDRVERGDVVGMMGDSGNADGLHPHLHFELRAPFALDWSETGEERQIDAFNPFPSLARADPRR